MSAPMLSEVLPDLVEEMVHLLREQGADPLCEQLRALHIESICDCGDENCGASPLHRRSKSRAPSSCRRWRAS